MKNLLALVVLILGTSVFAQDSKGRQRNPSGGGTQSGGRQGGGTQSGGSQSGGRSGGSDTYRGPTRRDTPSNNNNGNYQGGARRRIPRPDDSGMTGSTPTTQPSDNSVGNAVRRQRIPRDHSNHFGGYTPHHPYDTGTNSYYWHTYGGRRYCHYRDAYGVSWYYWYYDDGYYVTRYHDGFWWRHDPYYNRWVYLYGGGWYYRSGNTVYLYEEDRNDYQTVDDGYEGPGPIDPEKISLTANLGAFGLNEGSGVINENRGYLDFDGTMSGMAVGAEVNIGINKHVEGAVGVGYQKASVNTQYLDYTYDNGSEIRQQLTLTNVPVNAHVKIMPWGRDQRIQPYVGAGVQVNKWNYRESGEFIDFASENWDVYRETYKAGGTAVGPIALVGLKVPLNNRVSIGGEYRHQWAKGKLPEDGGFASDHVDLGGGSFQAGLTIKLK